MVSFRFGPRRRRSSSQKRNNTNEASDSDMSSLPTSNSPIQENIEQLSTPNTSPSSPIMPLTKAHYKNTERGDMSEISISPKKNSTARNVLNFFDSPRIAMFKTPKKKTRRLYHNHQEHTLPLNECPLCMDKSDTNVPLNVMEWIHDEAPNDIVPKILSFAGIRKVHAISQVNKSWSSICNSEGVWRTLCEDTHKWVKGRDPLPKRLDVDDCAMEIDNEEDKQRSFWKQYYCDNPIVPLDYSTLESALAGVSTKTKVPGLETKKNVLYTIKSRSVRIFVQPGLYVVKERMMFDTVEDSVLTIETLDNSNRSLPEQGHESESCDSVSPMSLSSMIYDDLTNARRSSPTIRDRFSCRSASEDVDHQGSNSANLSSLIPAPKQATIILKTKRKNEPIFNIRQGTLRLSKLVMIHYSPGVDIWDGNAAIQVQPRMEDDRPVRVELPNKPPTAIIDRSDVMSLSGRGIVAIDGGYTTVRKSHIHNCAATGIYVGGPGSMATVETSDIIQNGYGNERHRRGIARGHSGVYLEQGVAILTDCNISNNALTGISAVSRDNALLTVTNSDLMGNGSLQLEIPPNGTESRRRSIWKNNDLSTMGCGRFRSGLVLSNPVAEGVSVASADSTVHSSPSVGSS